MRDWKTYLAEFTPATALRDEIGALRACQLAIHAAEQGTYGVGAVLMDDAGEIMVEGHNEVHMDTFRSDLHAEMVVMNKFEATPGPFRQRAGLTLITSLEPCPMCMTRLIFAGIGTILHVCADPAGGMVHRKSALPPVFQQLTADLEQVWERAQCSEVLRLAAFQIWDQSRLDLDRRIVSRSNGRDDPP